MILLAIFSLLAVLLTTGGVEGGFSSAGSSSSSASDGSGHTFTQSNNNGQGQFVYTQTRPGSVPVTTTGNIPPIPSNSIPQNVIPPNVIPPNAVPPNVIPPNAISANPNQFYGPANFGQPAFGLNYGPSYPYNPYGSMTPAFTSYPQPPAFGYNPPFQPVQPLAPYQPFQPFAAPLATPQEFSAYLNSIQQQYNTYYKQQQELLNAWKNTPFVTGYSGVPNYAYATGAYGPNGVQQTAGVFPLNKSKPNVDNRFDPSDNMSNNIPPSGFFGVQTASFSSSSDVNGKKTHKEGASTTINNNGKVTTFNVEN